MGARSTSSDSERAFSGGRQLISEFRCSVAPKTIRRCMLLKSWMKALGYGDVEFKFEELEGEGEEEEEEGGEDVEEEEEECEIEEEQPEEDECEEIDEDAE